MRILTRKQLLELIQFGNWHPYLSRITWDKWQQLYHVTQSEQRISGSCHYWRASKGGVRHKGLYALAQPATDSSELHILLSAPTEYFCRGNVYAQEERAFQSLWNLQKLKYTYISCTNYPACTLQRKYAVWKLQFLVFNGEIYWERVTFKILKITFKVSPQKIAQGYSALNPPLNGRVSKKKKQAFGDAIAAP